MKNDGNRRPSGPKFQRHVTILIWKSYLQRQRRWRLLALETAFGAILFLTVIFIAKPVFLTPLEAEPEHPLSTKDILSHIQSNTLLGYAPNMLPYSYIMDQAASVLNIPLLAGNTENELNDLLYNKSLGTPINLPVIWIIFKPEEANMWKFSIRSTERARYSTSTDDKTLKPNIHLHTGFLAVQVAISRAIVNYVSEVVPDFEVNLVSMPVSPLMQQDRVRQALSLILLCFTLAFLPAILETQALVVWETQNMFKRALRMRNVSYTCMYLSWLVYAYLTALPVCVLGAVTMILTFRWIHLINSMLILVAYLSVMVMVALVMAMFHKTSRMSCIWTTLYTLLQTYLAQMLVHHQYDTLHVTINFVLHILLPQLGLINAFNEFALLSTGHQRRTEGRIEYMLLSWGLLITFYFGLLMLLQRTIGQQQAIGGQVSWRSIIFKKAKNQSDLHRVVEPVRSEFKKLQEVDEFVAKAITFRDVCKETMGVPVLHNLTFDIYRGEYTVMYTPKIQEKMINTLDDVLTGLTLPDSGEIRVLGDVTEEYSMPLNMLYMMGYCHRSETLVDDLTVEEHFALFTAICLWYESTANVVEYGHIRYKQLVKECDLVSVANTRIRDLDNYYRAQLCWAIATLIEPRVVLIPNLQDEPVYRAVVMDKIVQFRKYMTIVRFLFSSLETEYADRVFIFDTKILVFGGTPAYMFFKYGRDYRVRLTLRTSSLENDPDQYNDLLTERVERAGGSVRAYLGSLIILRAPAIPSEPFAELITDITDNAEKYGVTSTINISIADSEEVVRRAINEARSIHYRHLEGHSESAVLAKVALNRFRGWLS